MKTPGNQHAFGFMIQPRRVHPVKWGILTLAAVSVLASCTTQRQVETVAGLIMRAGMETAEDKEYERKEVIKSGDHSFLVQKHRTTGDYYIVDPTGRRHACLGKDCNYTAFKVAQELTATSAEGGGGGGGGGGSH